MIFVSELSLLLIILGIRTIFIEGHNLPNKALLFYAFVILIAVGTLVELMGFMSKFQARTTTKFG
jgi:hypothetical protein